VIEQVKAMLTSPDPVQRRQAEAFIRHYGRSFLGTAANTATGGFSDWLMTKELAAVSAHRHPLRLRAL